MLEQVGLDRGQLGALGGRRGGPLGSASESSSSPQAASPRVSAQQACEECESEVQAGAVHRSAGSFVQWAILGWPKELGDPNTNPRGSGMPVGARQSGAGPSGQRIGSRGAQDARRRPRAAAPARGARPPRRRAGRGLGGQGGGAEGRERERPGRVLEGHALPHGVPAGRRRSAADARDRVERGAPAGHLVARGAAAGALRRGLHPPRQVHRQAPSAPGDLHDRGHAPGRLGAVAGGPRGGDLRRRRAARAGLGRRARLGHL